MDAKYLEIEKGMRVIAADDTDLGKVTHIWTDVGGAPTAPQNYFVASEGGFFGMGERSLYIPFEAVERAVPRESVTVTGTGEECIALYSAKPEAIKKKEVLTAEAAVVASTTPVIFH